MSYNINSDVILELQKYLINLRNFYPSLPALYPTGVYDGSTRNAVTEYQRIKELPVTGVVDIKTWNEIIFDNDQYIRKIQPPERITVSPPEFKDVKLGDERDIVYAIKILLNNINKRFANHRELPVTNIYDEETERAVIQFQKRSMLPITGVVDKETWNTLVSINTGCKYYD